MDGWVDGGGCMTGCVEMDGCVGELMKCAGAESRAGAQSRGSRLCCRESDTITIITTPCRPTTGMRSWVGGWGDDPWVHWVDGWIGALVHVGGAVVVTCAAMSLRVETITIVTVPCRCTARRRS